MTINRPLLVALVLAANLSLAHAQSSGAQSAPSSISLPDARAIIENAMSYARSSTKSLMTVVVLDNAGHLVSLDRMDGASFHLEKFARGKAFLALITRRNTQDAADLAKTRPDRYFGIMGMYPGEVYMVGGGLPIVTDGKLVGAVGIAGLPQGMDEKAGQAGIDALQRSRKP